MGEQCGLILHGTFVILICSFSFSTQPLSQERLISQEEVTDFLKKVERFMQAQYKSEFQKIKKKCIMFSSQNRQDIASSSSTAGKSMKSRYMKEQK